MSHVDTRKAIAHNKKLAAKKKHILNSEMRDVEEKFESVTTDKKRHKKENVWGGPETGYPYGII